MQFYSPEKKFHSLKKEKREKKFLGSFRKLQKPFSLGRRVHLRARLNGFGTIFFNKGAHTIWRLRNISPAPSFSKRRKKYYCCIIFPPKTILHFYERTFIYFINRSSPPCTSGDWISINRWKVPRAAIVFHRNRSSSGGHDQSMTKTLNYAQLPRARFFAWLLH